MEQSSMVDQVRPSFWHVHALVSKFVRMRTGGFRCFGNVLIDGYLLA
jgi:hypothetical protein